MYMKIDCFLLLLSIVSCIGGSDNKNRENLEKQDTSFWNINAQRYLDHILSLKNNENKAKNVIFFVGDGMGISTITSGRIYKGQQFGYLGEEYKLSFEKFPNSGLSKTYNVDTQVTDSAAGANALFSGVKTKIHMVGLDARAPYNKCNATVNKISSLKSLAVLAQKSGKDTGFVTTTRVTHATPSALYAHVNNRAWECDSDIPSKYKSCVKDIARQLVEDETGQNFKVIMGGGDRCMCYQKKGCDRKDKISPAKIWQQNNPNGKIVKTKDELLQINPQTTEKLMGIFGPSHLAYRGDNVTNMPSLATMTKQAIDILKKSKDGFFLMVEGGKIDLAHHKNKARLAMMEVSDFDDAVVTALNLVNLDETLIIVTADHSHGMTINGYPKRGNDILGHIKPNSIETLTYANGPAAKDSEDVDFVHKKNPAGTYSKRETHAGEDVGVFAIGPWSHLLRGTFEQNYIPHVAVYAACYKDETRKNHCEHK